MPYLCSSAVLVLEQEAGQVDEAEMVRGLEPVARRVALGVDGAVVGMVVQMVLVGLVAMPKVHHLGPVLIGQVPPLGDAIARHYCCAAALAPDLEGRLAVERRAAPGHDVGLAVLALQGAEHVAVVELLQLQAQGDVLAVRGGGQRHFSLAPALDVEGHANGGGAALVRDGDAGAVRQ